MNRLAPTLAAGLVLALGAPAAAEPFGRVEAAAPLGEAALDQQRGGLRTPDGLEFGFGAVVRTFVDGAMALETHVTWTDQGPVEMSGLGAAPQALALPGGAEAWRGLVLPGDGGATTILHKLDDGQVRNVILNTANNRDIRQETEVTLNVPALDEVQRQALSAQTAMRLDEAMADALSHAAR
ncbi:MAG: hypothetical protein ACK4YQ_15415 [Phenylobacterium sp.]|uniref:hypothetical protein n=1 Tax=Phenylobacterium sp. TaxID=1871053 RepID=UPI003918BD9E